MILELITSAAAVTILIFLYTALLGGIIFGVICLYEKIKEYLDRRRK